MVLYGGCHMIFTRARISTENKSAEVFPEVFSIVFPSEYELEQPLPNEFWSV